MNRRRPEAYGLLSLSALLAAMAGAACGDDPPPADPSSTGATGGGTSVGTGTSTSSAGGASGSTTSVGGSATGQGGAGGAGGAGGNGGTGGEPGAPVADAGSDGFHASGAALDASATTNPASATLTYTWAETSSEGVTFGNNGSSDPSGVTVSLASFPDGVAAIPITLELTVSDGSESSTDTVDLVLYRTDYAYASGDGAGAGLSPDDPASVSAALSLASSSGTIDTVAVAEGTVTVNSDPNMDNDIGDATSLVIPANVALRGGYDDVDWARDPATNVTIITDAATTGIDNNRAIHVPQDATGGLIEGFTIRQSVRPNGSVGIYIGQDANPTIRGNRFESLGTVSIDVAIKGDACGATIENNVNDDNMFQAVSLSGATSESRRIRNNVLHGSQAVVSLVNGPITVVSNNTLVATALNATGIFVYAQVEAHNNLFVATAVGGYEQCIEESNSGNLIKAKNNDFAHCVFALYDNDGNCGDGNCTIAELNALSAGNHNGNFNADPAFVDADNFDYRLAAGSPINTREGGVDGVAEGWGLATDLDGTARTATLVGSPTNDDAAGWSVGAYEKD